MKTMDRKDPSDKLDYYYDFSLFFPGRALDRATIIQEDDDGTLLMDAQTISGLVVRQDMHGGTDGKTYRVACLGHTVDGRQRRMTISIPVTRE